MRKKDIEQAMKEAVAETIYASGWKRMLSMPL